MDLKKFRTSVTALTLGMFLITNLGVPVFVKASDDGQKLSEIKEKVGKSCTIDSTKDTNEILKTDLKKFKKPVKTLTLGTSIITFIGLAKLFLDKVVNVKENVENPKVTVSGKNNTCSGKITKVAKIEEKKDSITTENTKKEEETQIGSRSIPSERGKLDRYHQGKENVENPKVTVSEKNNTCSGEITEVTEIEEKKDSITTENTKKSEIIEIKEVIEDDDNSEEEIPIGSRQIQPGSGKLDEFHQGVVSGYLDATTLAKMKQVNKKTADGTECSGFITDYIENFYNKFTETKTHVELTPDYAGNCLYSLNSGDRNGYLCDSSESAIALQKLFRTQVRLVPLIQDFIHDEEITQGLQLDFNRIVIKDFYTLYLLLPRYYKVDRNGPEEYNQISEDLFKLEMRLLNKDYIRSLSSQSTYIPKVENYACFKKTFGNGRIGIVIPESPKATFEMNAKLRTYNDLKKECLLDRQSPLRILPGRSTAEKEQYFEENVLPIVGVEHTQPKPDLPKELLDRIRTDNEMTEIEFNKIYQMVQDEIPEPEQANQSFDYGKLQKMPEHSIVPVNSFENPYKTSTITLDGKTVELTYKDLRRMQLFQELPIWSLFGPETVTADKYLLKELGGDKLTIRGTRALSLIKPQRFEQILINLYEYGLMDRCDINRLHYILKEIANNPGSHLRCQFRKNLNEETLQNVITLLRFLQTPYEYNELFLRRAIVRLLLQTGGWCAKTVEQEHRVLELFLKNGLVRDDSDTVKKLIEAIRNRPNPAGWTFAKEYKEYESYLNSVFPDAFTPTLRF